MRRTGKANVLTALIGRETNFRRTHDHDLLASYAEDASVMSCNRTKTKLEPVKFHDGTQFTNIDEMKKYHKEDFETGLR